MHFQIEADSNRDGAKSPRQDRREPEDVRRKPERREPCAGREETESETANASAVEYQEIVGEERFHEECERNGDDQVDEIVFAGAERGERYEDEVEKRDDAFGYGESPRIPPCKKHPRHMQ